MSHDTPLPTVDQLRWCEHCQLSIIPSRSESGVECPSCGEEL